MLKFRISRFLACFCVFGFLNTSCMAVGDIKNVCRFFLSIVLNKSLIIDDEAVLRLDEQICLEQNVTEVKFVEDPKLSELYFKYFQSEKTGNCRVMAGVLSHALNLEKIENFVMETVSYVDGVQTHTVVMYKNDDKWFVMDLYLAYVKSSALGRPPLRAIDAFKIDLFEYIKSLSADVEGGLLGAYVHSWKSEKKMTDLNEFLGLEEIITRYKTKINDDLTFYISFQ
jgi:hypothetical protein